jgi:hypothetical protein
VHAEWTRRHPGCTVWAAAPACCYLHAGALSRCTSVAAYRGGGACGVKALATPMPGTQHRVVVVCVAGFTSTLLASVPWHATPCGRASDRRTPVSFLTGRMHCGACSCGWVLVLSAVRARGGSTRSTLRAVLRNRLCPAGCPGYNLARGPRVGSLSPHLHVAPQPHRSAPSIHRICPLCGCVVGSACAFVAVPVIVILSVRGCVELHPASSRIVHGQVAGRCTFDGFTCERWVSEQSEGS